MDLSDFLNGLLLLLVGGIAGGIGTYLIKPALDVWLEKRKKQREAKEAKRKDEEKATEQHQLAEQYAADYRTKLVQELKELRILDMVRPLDLERTYVRVSIQEERPLRYADADKMAARSHSVDNMSYGLSQQELEEERVESLFPEEALRRYRHMVVLGDPGAGKTTMLKYLCLLSAQGKLSSLPDLPLFVALNRYARADQSLLSFLLTDLAERYGFEQAPPYLNARLEQGSVLLLFDGLDEVLVGSPLDAQEAYARAAAEINQIAVRYPKCPIVVTSRRVGWKGLLAPSFLTMTVLDFNWDDIQHFIDNWFGQRVGQAKRLQSILSQQSRMRALAANPLLLSLIALVYERDLELPERRAKLYERCIQVLLTEWDAHRGIKRASHFTTDRKRDLLEDVALHFHCQGLRYYPKQELLAVIRAYLPTINISAEEANTILDEVSAQHGLLKEQAAEWYGFLHLTLQEYFAAVSLDKSNRLDVALAQIHNPWWEEAILLLAGMIKDATPLLDAILLDREDIFCTNLLMAGRCLAGTPRISRADLREKINTDIKRLIEDEGVHWLPRSRAVRILGESDIDGHAQYMIGLLNHEGIDLQVRIATAEALGATGKKEIAQPMANLLGNEQIDPAVRVKIADALGLLSGQTITRELLAMLVDQNLDPQVRGQIARALGSIGDRTVIPVLLELISDPSLHMHIAWSAGRALIQLQAFPEPGKLLTLLRDKRLNLEAQWSMAKSLGDLGPDASSQVLEWLADDSVEPTVRFTAAHRLLHFDGTAARAKMHELYMNPSIDISLRAALCLSLLELGERDRIPELKAFLADPSLNDYVSRKIAERLVSLGERDIIESIMRLIEVPLAAPQGNQLLLAQRLVYLGDSLDPHQLITFLRNKQVDVRLRTEAAAALAATKLGSCINEVKSLVSDESLEISVRGRALRSLAQDKESIPWLVKLLGQADLGSEAYLALHTASRLFGIRIFRVENGDSYEMAATVLGKPSAQ